jgi:hypothetical protein
MLAMVGATLMNILQEMPVSHYPSLISKHVYGLSMKSEISAPSDPIELP